LFVCLRVLDTAFNLSAPFLIVKLYCSVKNLCHDIYSFPNCSIVLLLWANWLFIQCFPFFLTSLFNCLLVESRDVLQLAFPLPSPLLQLLSRLHGRTLKHLPPYDLNIPSLVGAVLLRRTYGPLASHTSGLRRSQTIF
jgi:hypothetical protein